MTAWDIDEAIEILARRQHGAFSDAQARSAGATHRMIRRRVQTTRWVELDRLVYAIPTSPGTFQRQCVAATLAVPGSAVSHRTAAVVHGLTGFRPGPVHVLAPQGSHPRTRLAVVHQSDWPRVTVVHGIRTVSMADTFVQIAGAVADPHLRAAFEDAVVAHRGFLPAMQTRALELAGSRLRGIGRLRVLLAEYDCVQPSASELERRLDGLLNRVVVLPAVLREAPLPGWDRGAARVDRLIPEWRLIVEADGRRWHTRYSDFERDRWRDNVATTHGYDVLRFTFARIVHHPDECLALLEDYSRRQPNAAA